MSLSLPTKIPNHHPNSIYQSGININSRRHILVSSSLFPSMKAPISSSSTELHMSSTSKIQEESECDSELTEEEIKLQRARVKEERKAKKQKARDKRREFIGMAKAVDRGQWPNIYNPGGSDGVSFEAKSGLPDRTKPFLVLGIESSCDDTGGMCPEILYAIQFVLLPKIIHQYIFSTFHLVNFVMETNISMHYAIVFI